MSEKILFVDDDPHILKSCKRNLGFDFEIDTALGGEDGVKTIEEDGPYAVVVSDMRMPGMNGTQFLASVRKRWPDTVRMLLTGQAEMSDAIAVVNEGQIFRFLTKPCPPEVFSQALNDGLLCYRTITSEKELLGKTLKGSVKLLMDVLAIVNPGAYSRSKRVRELASKIAKRVAVKNLWQVDLAVLLSRIGYVTVPAEILAKKNRGDLLTEGEKRQYYRYLENGSKLVKNIPRLQEIAQAMLYQEKKFNGEGPPYDAVGKSKIPLLARVLKIVYDFDDLLTKEGSIEKAYKKLLHQKSWYDANIFEALKLEVLLWDDEQRVVDIEPRKVKVGMVAAADVRTTTDMLLVARNQEISETVRLCIVNYARKNQIIGPVKVFK
ncbi:MAG: HD domain-containing phosphohydrolase [bacterium]